LEGAIILVINKFFSLLFPLPSYRDAGARYLSALFAGSTKDAAKTV